MNRCVTLVLACCGAVALAHGPAAAQGRWWDDAFRDSHRGERGQAARGAWRWDDRGPAWFAPEAERLRPPAPLGGDIRDGGARPAIAAVAPPVVSFPYDYPASSIVIDSAGKRLYFVLPGKQAYAYEISVGREGFDWTGSEVVARKQAWPDWYPPAEMRLRDPTLPARMTGGVRNPLGAMALYLGTTLYRIHGTNDERSLGQAASSGCFRMMNASVLHLASMTEVGTRVTVVADLASVQVVEDTGAARRESAWGPDEPTRRWR